MNICVTLEILRVLPCAGAQLILTTKSVSAAAVIMINPALLQTGAVKALAQGHTVKMLQGPLTHLLASRSAFSLLYQASWSVGSKQALGDSETP